MLGENPEQESCGTARRAATNNLSRRCGDAEKNKKLTTCHPEVPVKRARVFFSAIVGPRDLLRPKLQFDEDRYQYRMALEKSSRSSKNFGHSSTAAAGCFFKRRQARMKTCRPEDLVFDHRQAIKPTPVMQNYFVLISYISCYHLAHVV